MKRKMNTDTEMKWNENENTYVKAKWTSHVDYARCKYRYAYNEYYLHM